MVRLPRYQGSWGQHGAHLGSTGPRWAPCWPHELCYLGYWPCWPHVKMSVGLSSNSSKAFIQLIAVLPLAEGLDKCPTLEQGPWTAAVSMRWNGYVGILTTFLSLIAPEIDEMTASGAASVKPFVTKTFPFKCMLLVDGSYPINACR